MVVGYTDGPPWTVSMVEQILVMYDSDASSNVRHVRLRCSVKYLVLDCVGLPSLGSNQLLLSGLEGRVTPDKQESQIDIYQWYLPVISTVNTWAEAFCASCNFWVIFQGNPQFLWVAIIEPGNEQGMRSHTKTENGMQLAYQPKLEMCVSGHGCYLHIQRETQMQQHSQSANRGLGCEGVHSHFPEQNMIPATVPLTWQDLASTGLPFSITFALQTLVECFHWPLGIQRYIEIELGFIGILLTWHGSPGPLMSSPSGPMYMLEIVGDSSNH